VFSWCQLFVLCAPFARQTLQLQMHNADSDQLVPRVVCLSALSLLSCPALAFCLARFRGGFSDFVVGALKFSNFPVFVPETPLASAARGWTVALFKTLLYHPYTCSYAIRRPVKLARWHEQLSLPAASIGQHTPSVECILASLELIDWMVC